MSCCMHSSMPAMPTKPSDGQRDPKIIVADVLQPDARGRSAECRLRWCGARHAPSAWHVPRKEKRAASARIAATSSWRTSRAMCREAARPQGRRGGAPGRPGIAKLEASHARLPAGSKEIGLLHMCVCIPIDSLPHVPVPWVIWVGYTGMTISCRPRGDLTDGAPNRNHPRPRYLFLGWSAELSYTGPRYLSSRMVGRIVLHTH